MNNERHRVFLTMRSSTDQSFHNRDEQLNIWMEDDSTVQRITEYIESELKAQRPNAKLMFTENRRGERVAVGIYDMPLVLNQKGMFKVQNQYAPQLLSALFIFNEEHGRRGELFAAYSSC